MTNIQDLFSNIYMLGFFSSALTFIVSIRMYPIIIYTVITKNLMDEPGGRKIHSTKIPTFGGVGLFASFSFSLLVFGMSVGLQQLDLIKLLALIASTLLLLFLGIKDDLIAIPPKKKLIGQLISSGIIIFYTNVRITSFEGLLGIEELPYMVSVLFTLFVFILVINAFNLVDGIDGLGGLIAIISSAVFGVFFLLNESLLLALVSFILIGAILGFLIFNLSDKRKLFMGDSGSLFLGFLLVYQGISFLVLNQTVNTPFYIPNAPVLLLAVLSFPLLDTLRVFAIRVKEKRSPFSPDRNHIHHRLLDIGLNHKRASITIAMANTMVIGLVVLIRDLNINLQLLITIFVGSVLYLSPFLKVFGKNMALEVVETKGNQESRTEQVLMGEIPMQQMIAEDGSAEIEKSSRQKRTTKRWALFQKSPKVKISFKKTSD